MLLQHLGRAQQLDRHHVARQFDRLLGLERAVGTTLDGFAAIVTGG
jgi:hypothetical protein